MNSFNNKRRRVHNTVLLKELRQGQRFMEEYVGIFKVIEEPQYIRHGYMCKAQCEESGKVVDFFQSEPASEYGPNLYEIRETSKEDTLSLL